MNTKLTGLIVLVLALPLFADSIDVPGDYPSIQEAVDAATPGDQILVSAGIYTEQVHITVSDISIIGGGLGSTIIQSPAVLTEFFTTSAANYPVVFVDGAEGVALSELTIDGNHMGDSNYRFVGLGYWNGGGSLVNVAILNVKDGVFSGAQHGVGVYSYNDTGGPYEISMEHVLVDDFQKTGVALSGEGLTVSLYDVIVLGEGPTDVTAQNGIQVAWGASGSVTSCRVEGIAYTGASWTATGFLCYGAGTVDGFSLEIIGSQTSIYYIDSDGSLDGCNITNPLSDPFYAYNSGAKSAAPLPLPKTLEIFPYSQRTQMNVSVQGSQFIGNYLEDSWGPCGWAAGDLDFSVNGSVIVGFAQGLNFYESGGTLTGSSRENDLGSNTVYGAWSNTAEDYDVIMNWWGHDSGPYHPTENPSGQGCPVSDHLIFEPWQSGTAVEEASWSELKARF